MVAQGLTLLVALAFVPRRLVRDCIPTLKCQVARTKWLHHFVFQLGSDVLLSCHWSYPICMITVPASAIQNRAYVFEESIDGMIRNGR